MRLVAALITLCLAACAPQRFPETPLLRGVDAAADFETGQRLVQGRLEQRYRISGSEVGLAEYLASQGFRPRRIANSLAPGQPIYGEARLEQGWGVCNRVIGVYWRANAAGALTELSASYGDTGCF